MWFEKNKKIISFTTIPPFFKENTHKKQYLMSIKYYANIILKFI
jgi:hypothetical protein